MKTAYILLLLPLLIGCTPGGQMPPQTKETLRGQIEKIIQPFDGKVGVSIIALEDNDTLTIGNDHPYPMLSTYKFPLAIAILHMVDEGKLQPDQKITVTKAMLRPDTWSPMLEKYPNGGEVTVAELLDYSASQSDNNACDILFELAGGTQAVEEYIHGIGITGIAIKTTETEMSTDWKIQYGNWVHPTAMTQLLERFYHQKDLSKTSNDFLMKLMTDSPTAKERIKGLLPENTAVAHKTGTSDTNEDGLRAAVNDVGIITLPNGKHIAIAIYVSDTKKNYEAAELIIAKIARTVYNHYSGKTGVAVCKRDLIDTTRHRPVPLTIYENLSVNNGKVVILSSGYKSEYDRYSYIANRLANDGYLVVSIQHDLPGDAPIAQEGDIYKLREPVWKRGDSTILFTANELQQRYTDRRFDKLVLIGHSNGGDMSILLSKQHPERVSAVITLDHRRMPVQLTKKPKFMSLRASDYKADPGVLPTKAQQQQYDLRIIELGKDAKHSEMDDSGSRMVKDRILEAISEFLAE